MSASIQSHFTVKKLTWLLVIIAIITAVASAYNYNRIQQIKAFNQAVLAGEKPATDKESFEAKFAKALYLANKRYYKEATLINGRDLTVRAEAEYLMNQAKNSYVASLKTDNAHWDAKHNLDRLLTMLPNTPTPGVGESENPGLIMGNIPVGLP